MIGHATDAVGFTTRVPRDLGQIRVKVGAQRGIEARETILGVLNTGWTMTRLSDCGMAEGAWGGLSALHLVFAAFPGPLAQAGMGRAFSADKTKCNRSGRRESSAVRRNADAFRYEAAVITKRAAAAYRAVR